jgi:hypothetical protein
MGDIVSRQDFGGLGGFLGGLAQRGASPELGMIENEQYTDRVISAIEDGFLTSINAPTPFSVQGALRPVNVADGINQFETDYVKGLLDQGLVTVEQVAAQTGIPAAEIQQQYNTLTGLDPETEENINQELADFLESQETEDFSTTGLENELEGGMLDTGAGDESIVTDDPQAQWEEVDKDADFDVILGKALDIFGAYNRDAIKNVVDVVNDRGMSAADVAIATGNTIESINQAAAESGTAIENQELGDPTVVGGADDGSDITEISGGTLIEGTTPETQDNGEGLVLRAGDDTVEDATNGETAVVMDTPVTPVTPTILPELPKKPSVTLIQNILNEAPITESILFPTQFTKLENVQQGMFGQFLSAAGGNNDIS